MPKRRTQKRPMGNFQNKGKRYLGILKTLLDQQRSNVLRKTLNYTSRKLKLRYPSRKRK